MLNKSHLIIDGNAVLYKYYFAYKDEPLDDLIAIAHVSMLNKIQLIHNMYKTDNVVVVFDCTNNSWRKIYTGRKNPEKITHRPYKGGRRETLTPKEKEKIDAFDGRIPEYYEFFKTQTSLPVMCADFLEGDDLIAGYVQRFPDDDHVIYSSDKDFMQLINSINGKVTLVESQKDTERTIKNWDNNPDLFLFEKCFRGEPRGGDNIQNAYPRLFRAKILEAYNDSYKYNNIRNNTFDVSDIGLDGNPVVYTYKTGDLLDENKLLMGLDQQPPVIRELINNAIDDGINNRGRFDYRGFLTFCKQYGMVNAIRDKDNFINLLSRKYV